MHPEDLQSCLETYTRALDHRESFQRQYRLRRHDGEFRWVFETGVPRFNADGSFAGYIGSCLDVTERKLAEEALASLGGKLIAAQEQERDPLCTRAARRHQPATRVRVGIARRTETESTGIRLPRSPAASRESEAQVAEISTSVQALSHRLHSSKLDTLGLVAALRSFCREFSDQHRVDVKFSHDPIPDGLPQEISLCLFRVVQAALVNALKHSGVKSFGVHLGSSRGAVHLNVQDRGVGFDVEKMLTGHGLGLISMRERVRFVNGEISILSKPNGGTTITVDVPLPAEAVTSQSA